MKKEGPASDEARQGRQRREQKDLARQRRDDLRAVMGTEEGRRFLYRLIYEDLALEHGYPAQDAGVYRHLGRQDAARELKISVLGADPLLWEQAVLEQIRSQTKRANASSMEEATEENESD